MGLIALEKIKKNLFDKCVSLVGFAGLRNLPEKVRFNIHLIMEENI